ncbi:cytochrome c oxidase assembly factor Coa1 family protein [Flavobacterium sp. Arc2]|uniref:cytochrome c oxidase assembly factor Coa1 family protein n=1 Tax=Flavobacterium sp. Arc2 TaxID=3046685 RepID=UPI00352D7AD8
MDNELITTTRWWKTNWKWFLPTCIVLFTVGAIVIGTTSINSTVTDFAQAYSDNSLYNKAIQKGNANQRVKEVLGAIEPIDKLAILEGDTKYTNDNTAVTITVRIKGSKANGKMDISAYKNGTEWEYKKITVRIKQPKEEIAIIN